MREKFEEFLNKYFKKIKKIEDAEVLKEEIVNDLLEENKDLEKDGINEDERFLICINSLGDLKNLIKSYKKENRRLENKIILPKYKLGEELINSISHGLGVLMSIAFMVLLIIKSSNGIELFSSLFYGITSILLYLSSCLYHSLKPNNGKRVFRIIDHCNIFLLIAGTYTPFVLCVLPKTLGWWMFGIVWFLAVVGIVLNSINLVKFRKISMILYLVMGWCIVFTFKYIILYMDKIGIIYMVLGGVIYTLGAVLYGIGKKKAYIHSVFHIFCLIAGIMFFISIYGYVFS